MKKLISSLIMIGLATGINVSSADTSSTNMNATTSINCPPGNLTCNVNDIPDTTTSPSCFTLGSDANNNINATLDKLGYDHPNTIAFRYVYQILVPDNSNQQQTRFFDFDTDTGNLIEQGTINN